MEGDTNINMWQKRNKIEKDEERRRRRRRRRIEEE
jgi:hypothetical protein